MYFGFPQLVKERSLLPRQKGFSWGSKTYGYILLIFKNRCQQFTGLKKLLQILKSTTKFKIWNEYNTNYFTKGVLNTF